jgi:hypothetical protein
VGIYDVEVGSAQSRSKTERLGEQERQGELWIHGVGLELRSKENVKCENSVPFSLLLTI